MPLAMPPSAAAPSRPAGLRSEPGRPGHHYGARLGLRGPVGDPGRDGRLRPSRQRRHPRPARGRRPAPAHPLVRDEPESGRHRRRPRLYPRPAPSAGRRFAPGLAAPPTNPDDPDRPRPVHPRTRRTRIPAQPQPPAPGKARNAQCTAPGCGRPAARCDLDHTVAWDQGGITCECGLAPLCRHHHRCKQAEGWHLAQPGPGVLVWRTPAGRTYATTPTVYPV